jgi:hypothetical protein
VIAEDYGAYKSGEKWGYKRPDGSVVIEPRFDSAGSFSEGLARVREGELWGFVDPSGNYVIEAQFEQARHFSGGVAKVKRDGRWALIDTKGAWVENVEAGTYLDDRGQFISKEEHQVWEKPPGQDDAREGK